MFKSTTFPRSTGPCPGKMARLQPPGHPSDRQHRQSPRRPLHPRRPQSPEEITTRQHQPTPRGSRHARPPFHLLPPKLAIIAKSHPPHWAYQPQIPNPSHIFTLSAKKSFILQITFFVLYLFRALAIHTILIFISLSSGEV